MYKKKSQKEMTLLIIAVLIVGVIVLFSSKVMPFIKSKSNNTNGSSYDEEVKSIDEHQLVMVDMKENYSLYDNIKDAGARQEIELSINSIEIKDELTENMIIQFYGPIDDDIADNYLNADGSFYSKFHYMLVTATVKACDKTTQQFGVHDLYLTIYDADNLGSKTAYEPRGMISDQRLGKKGSIDLAPDETYEFTNIYIVSDDLLEKNLMIHLNRGKTFTDVYTYFKLKS